MSCTSIPRLRVYSALPGVADALRKDDAQHAVDRGGN
jgi:hypothetical protein